ncbi:Sugar fermentation stimulation protein A [Roseivivax sp. THAF40]|uniref:DNA/RNA nuclease SfsA n=1 Tax=unclassified Roseivivax TaxID=2639302 RepID=UPI0012680350|nr:MULTISPECIES: DNA/RNA nuclease SfsA [unclassified Roseivivax]QFS84311.1 Sugar fermentation stimulation protein A [Roseivivax sp. THAF197b]QFT48139.1 Sugar fermentation stimulation protein A [Roseivivax sp. THAF40]
MRFQTPLVPARLIRRYKRFLADITLEDGREVTAHCANPGSMMGLAEPGSRIWVEPNDDPKKKLKWSWKIVEVPGGGRVCVDTGMANRVVREALEAGAVPGLEGYDQIRPEQKYGDGSRVDFLLQAEGRADAYVEVKSATLSRSPGRAEFPDSVTARGTKHLHELAQMAEAGHRAVMLFLLARDDAESLSIAADIDPAYASAFADAAARGVEMLALGTRITPERIIPDGMIPLKDV